MAPVGHARAGPFRDRGAQGPGSSGGVLSKCYVFHVCLRAVLELGFVLAQWKLFGFRVPVHFLCTSAPCSQPVDCYVSRPTEKTIFLLFMFCVGVFCILLNLLELNHLGWKKIRQVVRLRERGKSWGGCPGMRGGYETFPTDSPSPTCSLGFGGVTGTTSLPTLGLVVGHRPDWSCAAPGDNSPGKPRTQDPQAGERQPLKSQRADPKDTKGPTRQSVPLNGLGFSWLQDSRCRRSLRQRDNHLHVVDGEEARLAVDHALVPVLVYLVGEDDDVALLEAQLALVLWLKVVERAAARLVQRLGLWSTGRH
ncbi:hypothetical protein FQN60_004373 [Etheostoma spectabile]|uniref:Gap junction protein n=1 Tax=Etheostoma spectabile TaxID=54343 RepID=A0A5J5CWY6_9PERO|nr:hypothetical protein FQN60_004373 [Etheostoma spectabile]